MAAAILLLIFQLTFAVPVQSTADPTGKNIFTHVQRVLGKTRVPVRLPTAVGTPEDGQLYVSATANKDHYQIDIATMPNCDGGNVCSFGFVSGERKSTRSLRGKRVQLSNGRVGFFTPAECHAYCTMARLTWCEREYVYTVAVKAGTQDELIAMANSAIVGKL